MKTIHAFLTITDRGLRKASLISGYCGGAALALLLLLVCANIILRPLGHSIRGTLEMSGYLCALAVGLCMPLAQQAGSHISAGLFSGAVPRSLRRLELICINLICAGLMATLVWQFVEIGSYAIDMGEYIDGFGFSYLPMLAGFAAGIILHAALFLHGSLAALFRYSGHKSQKSDKPGVSQ